MPDRPSEVCDDPGDWQTDASPITKLGAMCSLDPERLAEGLQDIYRLSRAAAALEELPDGVRLSFPRTGNAARTIADFLRRDRQCCQRFTYEVAPVAGADVIDVIIRVHWPD